MAVLQVDNLTMRFGGITAVNRVSFAVERGQIFSVIGPNGAGKTTVFNAVTGIYAPTEGHVLFDGHRVSRPFTWKTGLFAITVGLVTALLLALFAVDVDTLWKVTIRQNTLGAKEPFPVGKALSDAWAHISGRGGRAAVALIGGFLIGTAAAVAVWQRSRRTPDVISREGIARTFQNIRLFHGMTVLENVLIGMDRRLPVVHPQVGTWAWFGYTWPGSLLTLLLTGPFVWLLLRAFVTSPREREAERRALDLLDFVGLRRVAGQLAKNLPYGDQRLLEIARALASEPKLLLLDEPAAGMNPSETVELMDLIRKIRDRGITVLLIEHHMNVVMGISDRVAVLDYGVKIAEGPPVEVSRDPKVIEAYLGKEEVG